MPKGIPANGFAPSRWDARALKLLNDMWPAGKTAAQIAAAIGGGVSRNAVVGKANRLGLAGRPSPIKVLAPGEHKAQRKYGKPIHRVTSRRIGNIAAEDAAKPPVARIVEPPRPPAYVPPQRTSSRDACAWPEGDPKQPGFHFCGKRPVVLGKPYCERHCAIAYRSPEQVATERAAAGGRAS